MQGQPQNIAGRQSEMELRSEQVCSLIRGRGVPVLIGAGVTIDAGGPGGASLGDDILSYLYPDAAAGRELNFEVAMESLPAGQQVRAQLVADRLKDLEPSETLMRLAELVRDGVVAPLIITPNFDHLAEQALRGVGVGAVRCLLGDDVDSATELIRDSEVTVLKVHGDLSHPLGMRLDPRTLEQLPKPLADSLSEVVEARGLLVVGYALRDPGLFQALTRGATKAIVAWVDVGPPSEVAARFLAFHAATGNAVETGVESFVDSLADQSFSRQIYETANDEIADEWACLDRLRGTGDPKGQLRCLMGAFDGKRAAKLVEVQALRNISAFDWSDCSDARSLREGLHLLRAAFERRGALPASARARVTARYMQELNRAVFHGVDDDFTASTGIGFAEVEGAVRAADRDFAEYSNRTGVSPCDRASLLIYAAEALKELQQQAPTPDPDRLISAQAKASDALNLLAALPESSSSPWKKSDYLAGVAERHLGVIHEYLAGGAGLSSADRTKHIEQMREHSRRASVLLEPTGDLAVRAYAEMNLCLAETRLLRRSDNDWSSLVSEYERLTEQYALAESNFRRVHDRRGLAWVNAHLAGMCGLFLELMGDRVLAAEASRVLQIADDMYRYATTGRAWARRMLGDSMALGLTSVQAASSLVHLSHQGAVREADIAVQLRLAIRLADEGVAHLSHTRRVQNAAIGKMSKAEALLMLAGNCDEASARHFRADAVEVLGEAIALVVRTGAMETVEFQSEYDELTGVLGRIRDRYSLTV
jgi:hypothetical protein